MGYETKEEAKKALEMILAVELTQVRGMTDEELAHRRDSLLREVQQHAMDLEVGWTVDETVREIYRTLLVLGKVLWERERRERRRAA